MEQRTVNDDAVIDPHGEITVRTWKPETLRANIKRWPLLETDQEKVRAIRHLEDSLAESVATTTNIALDGLLGFIATALDPRSSAVAEASHLAFGTGTTDPTGGDTALANEVHRTIVGDADSAGADLLTSTFLSQTEANGHYLTEVGLVGGPAGSSAPFLTRALFSPGSEIEKNSEMIATIDYVLQIRRPT